MKLEEYLELKGFTRAELSRRAGISKAAISKWVDIPEGRLAELMELTPDIVGETPEGIWDWPWERIKSEICSRRAAETDYEIARSLGLRVWELNKLIDRVRKAGADRVCL